MQIVSGLKYLHSHRVIHRDLKLGNLFLTDKMEEKIGDFGLATKLEFEGDRKRTICGTPNYIAPEIIDGKQGHSYEVDIWSLGVILYTLIIGKPPFETSEVKTTYKRIKTNSYSFPDHISISPQAKDLITKILNLDPSKRPTLDEILAHPFLHADGTIPKLMPVSTLACPPSASFMKQFAANPVPLERIRFEGTEQLSLKNDMKGAAQPNFQNSQKITVKLNNIDNDVKPQEQIKGASSVWVKKWVDYTSKYGLGNIRVIID